MRGDLCIAVQYYFIKGKLLQPRIANKLSSIKINLTGCPFLANYWIAFFTWFYFKISLNKANILISSNYNISICYY